MIRNVGTADRLVRTILGAGVLAGAWWTGPGSAGGVVLLVVAAVLLVTAATGFCPLYRLLHISTNRRPGPVTGSVGSRPGLQR